MRDRSFLKIAAGCVSIAAFLITAVCPGSALTLEQAIALAREHLPAYSAAMSRVYSNEALHKASLGPFLPSLDASASRNRKLDDLQDIYSQSYAVQLSYTLYDWGRRRSERNIAGLEVEGSREDLRDVWFSLVNDVKVSFYSVLAGKEILDHRTVQLEDATKDHDVANGRYKQGVAKLSDVLQASVRVEQARFNLTEARGALRKALAALNSLVGRDLDHSYDLEGRIDHEETLPDWTRIEEVAMQRPDVRLADLTLEVSRNNQRLVTTEFFPTFGAEVSYDRSHYGDSGGPDEDTMAGLTATWNVFELGKFYRRTARQRDIDAAQQDLKETKRQVSVEVRQTYEDVITAQQSIRVSMQLLEEAKHNYAQAFGEYKVGKTDILGLVQAESALASAKEQLTTSRLNYALSRALLERVAGLEDLGELGR